MVPSVLNIALLTVALLWLTSISKEKQRRIIFISLLFSSLVAVISLFLSKFLTPLDAFSMIFLLTTLLLSDLEKFNIIKPLLAMTLALYVLLAFLH